MLWGRSLTRRMVGGGQSFHNCLSLCSSVHHVFWSCDLNLLSGGHFTCSHFAAKYTLLAHLTLFGCNTKGCDKKPMLLLLREDVGGGVDGASVSSSTSSTQNRPECFYSSKPKKRERRDVTSQWRGLRVDQKRKQHLHGELILVLIGSGQTFCGKHEVKLGFFLCQPLSLHNTHEILIKEVIYAFGSYSL